MAGDVVQLTKFRPYQSRPMDHQREAVPVSLATDPDVMEDLDSEGVLQEMRRLAYIIRRRHGYGVDVDNRILEAVL